MTRILKFAAAVIVMLAHAIGPASAEGEFPQIRTVALTGEQAPGTPEGVQFSDFPLVRPVLNDRGEAAFSAILSDPIYSSVIPNINDTGIWSEGGGALHLVARADDQAPGVTDPFGGPNEFCLFFNELFVSEAGTTAFKAQFRPSSTTSCFTSNSGNGLWRETAGLSSKAVASRDLAPGVEPESTYRGVLQWPAFNNAEEFGFAAGYHLSDGSVGGTGVWTTQSGAPAPVAVPGTFDPDSGATIKSAGFPVALNDGGTATFLGGADAGSGERLAVMRGDPRDLDVVAMVGDTAPDIAGATFTFLFANMAINNAGTALFKGSTSIGVQGIWSTESAGGIPGLRLKSGDPAPGTTSGVFSFFEPVMNAGGEIALVGFSGSERGVWTGAPEMLQLVALTGQPAPGTAGGEVFCFFSPRLAINADGDVSFLALLCAPGTTFPSIGRGLWAWNADDGLIPIAVSGQPLDSADVAGKEVASVFTAFGNLNQFGGGASYTSSGNEDGQPSALGDGGKLAFAVEFTDSSAGVFVAALRADDPVSLLEALIEEVQQAGLAPGATNPLLDKLEGALAKIVDDNPANDHAAISLLEDFITILTAKADKQVPADLVEAWIADVQQIIELLSEATG